MSLVTLEVDCYVRRHKLTENLAWTIFHIFCDCDEKGKCSFEPEACGAYAFSRNVFRIAREVILWNSSYWNPSRSAVEDDMPGAFTWRTLLQHFLKCLLSLSLREKTTANPAECIQRGLAETPGVRRVRRDVAEDDTRPSILKLNTEREREREREREFIGANIK